MNRVMRVDVNDTGACNLRCVNTDRYCNGYPQCVAGHFHKIQDWFTPGHPERVVVREESKRSALGGYSRSRVIQGSDPHTTVEEVELHCRTLKFESLMRTVPVEAKPPPPEQHAAHD